MWCVHTVSGITFIRYTQTQKIGKPNNLKVLESKRTKGPKEDGQNRLRSQMPEGGEPQFDKLAQNQYSN